MTNYDLDANQLRAARVLLGWDLKDLSARSGISESTSSTSSVTVWEGSSPPSARYWQPMPPPGLSFLGAA